MTIASAIATKQQQIADSYTAVSNKGGTLPQAQNLTNLATAISSIPSGTAPTGTLSITANGVYDVTNYASADVSVSGGSTGKYQLLQHISDDSNNEIGTVCGFFTDANNVEYAVVCLDAQNVSIGAWCSSSTAVTNMPQYNSLASASPWGAKETATENTQLILDYCTANGYTSTACSHCRSKSFTIGGTTYYGQLPNIVELTNIAKYWSALGLPSSGNPWTSTQYDASYAYRMWSQGYIDNTSKGASWWTVVPILELPNA